MPGKKKSNNLLVFSQIVRLFIYRDNFVRVYKILFADKSKPNQNTGSNELVPISNKMALAFADCLQNQSNLQKLVSRSVRIFSFQGQMKTEL